MGVQEESVRGMGGDGRESKAGEVTGRRERKKIIGKMQAIVHLPLPCLVCNTHIFANNYFGC